MTDQPSAGSKALRAARIGALLALIVIGAVFVAIRHRTRAIAGELVVLETHLHELVTAIDERREPIPVGLVPTEETNVLPRPESLEEMGRRLGPPPNLQSPGRMLDLVEASFDPRQRAVLEQLDETVATGAYAEVLSEGEYPLRYEVVPWAAFQAHVAPGNTCLERAVGAARFARAVAAADELGETVEPRVLLALEPVLVACAARSGQERRDAAADALMRLSDERRAPRGALTFAAAVAQDLIDEAWRELDSTYALGDAAGLMAEAEEVVEQLEGLMAHEGPLAAFFDLDLTLAAMEHELGLDVAPPPIDLQSLEEERWARLQLRLLATMLRAGPAPVAEPGALGAASDPRGDRPFVIEADRVRAPSFDATDSPYDGVVAIAEPPAPPDPMEVLGELMVRETPTVRGSLAKETIRAVIRTQNHDMVACFEAAMDRVGVFEGRVVTRFIIGPDGSVTNALVTEGEALGDARFTPCVLGVVRSYRFPPPEGGGIVVVNYPFAFSMS